MSRPLSGRRRPAADTGGLEGSRVRSRNGHREDGWGAGALVLYRRRYYDVKLIGRHPASPGIIRVRLSFLPLSGAAHRGLCDIAGADNRVAEAVLALLNKHGWSSSLGVDSQDGQRNRAMLGTQNPHSSRLDSSRRSRPMK